MYENASEKRNSVIHIKAIILGVVITLYQTPKLGSIFITLPIICVSAILPSASLLASPLVIYVLPFFKNTNKLIEIVSSHLKSGGISISVGENFYNGLALNILKGNTNDVKNVIEKNVGSLSQYVPKLNFNKMNELVEIHRKYDIIPIFKCGYPVVSLIGVEEALTSDKNTISKILTDNYDYIFNIEMQYIRDESLYNRGKYICIVGEKV